MEQSPPETSAPPTPVPAPATPPTIQGAVGTVRKPTNRASIWSLATGLTGLLLPLVGLVGIITGAVGLIQIRRSERKETGEGLAVAGICTGVIGLFINGLVIFIVVVMLQAFEGITQMNVGIGLQQLHANALNYAQSNSAYPTHVVELALDPAINDPVYIHVLADIRSSGRSGRVMLGAYDFVNYNHSKAADDAVTAALETVDTDTSVYAFGDMWFVRLAEPTNDPDIVFAWCYQPVNDFLCVMKDDGNFYATTSANWDAAWSADAEARERLGLPALTPPALRNTAVAP